MRKIQVGNITYFITAESWKILIAWRVDPVTVETHMVGDTFRDFFEGDIYHDFVKDRRTRIAVLCGHGYYDSNGWWVYNDDTSPHKVADWTSRYDGEYDVLMIFVCNAESTRLQPAKHSLLVVPEGDIPFDIDQVVLPGGKILQLPRDNDKVPPEFLESYTGPFYRNYPEFIVLIPDEQF